MGSLMMRVNKLSTIARISIADKSDAEQESEQWMILVPVL